MNGSIKTAAAPPIFEQLSSLADRVRSRILLVLAGRELTVTELCAVLKLPQSTVSRHLKTLSDTGWITSRPDGTRRLYGFAPDELASPARELWSLAAEEVATTSPAQEDARRLAHVLAERRTRSREFFSAAGARWDRLRDELFGQRFYLLALLGLLDPETTVADLGCGTGRVSEALAPAVRRIVAVDESEAMLAAARERLARFGHVDLRQAQLEALPIEDRAVRVATLILVLQHLPDPGRVLGEVARILEPGGRLLVVDALPHERLELTEELGHVWMGFDEQRLARLLGAAGLRLTRFVLLPPEAEAKGPTLFAATAETALDIHETIHEATQGGVNA
jgi:ArsR family transcriptional regulator